MHPASERLDIAEANEERAPWRTTRVKELSLLLLVYSWCVQDFFRFSLSCLEHGLRPVIHPRMRSKRSRSRNKPKVPRRRRTTRKPRSTKNPSSASPANLVSGVCIVSCRPCLARQGLNKYYKSIASHCENSTLSTLFLHFLVGWSSNFLQ